MSRITDRTMNPNPPEYTSPTISSVAHGLTGNYQPGQTQTEMGIQAEPSVQKPIIYEDYKNKKTTIAFVWCALTLLTAIQSDAKLWCGISERSPALALEARKSLSLQEM